MKRLILAGIMVAFCCGEVIAQIVLSSADYPVSLIGADSLRTSTYTSVYPSLIPAFSGVWNMEVITDTIPYTIQYRVNDDFYQYADSNVYHLSSYGYNGNAQHAITADGIKEYGLRIKGKAISLTPLTISPIDTLFIPEQTDNYSAPLVKIALPATFNDNWGCSYVSRLDFELSVASYSLVHEPCFRRKLIDRRDTVVGWGNMRLRNSWGSISPYFEVLQVQTTVITTDSFYMTGVPAPASILGLLSLVQGKRDTSYLQEYYRKGEVTPLAEVHFRDASFTAPFKAITHVQRLQPNKLIDLQKSDSRLLVYPNPITKGMLYVDMQDNINECAFRLTDINGRQVLSGDIRNVGGFGKVKIPGVLDQGIYQLEVGAHPDNFKRTQIQVLSK